jgi:hypothetical protein
VLAIKMMNAPRVHESKNDQGTMTAVLLIGHVATEEGKGRGEDSISRN